MNELERLIAEQEKDARVGHRVFGVSVDSVPGGVDFFYRRSKQLANDPRHGTLNCYTNLGCRCTKCRAVAADQKRDERRRKRVDKGPYVYRLCCEECGSQKVKRERVYTKPEGAK